MFAALAGVALATLLGAAFVRTYSVARALDMGTTTPIISNIAATTTDTTASITWDTDQQTDGQILYGTTTDYSASTTLNTSLLTSHLMVLTGLTPNTQYHYQILSANASSTQASSTDQIFFTLETPATSTPTTTPEDGDHEFLQDQIDDLLDMINALTGRVTALEEEDNTGGGSTTTPIGEPTISPNNFQVRSGTTVDFTGRNWGFRESVTVSVGGNIIRTALADDEGNFSTGSITVGTTLGTETYTFHGLNTGTTLTQNIQIIP